MYRFFFSMTALFLVIVIPACGPAGGRTDSGQVLRVGNGAEPQELDPHLITGVPEHRLTSTLFEGLVDLDPVSLQPVPGVAERWDVSDDGTVYTFYLRSTAYWSNGDPVTAGDFVYSWQRILSPELASEYASMLYLIRGARAFNEGKLADFTKVGVKALDDHTLRVELVAPAPYFLSMQVHYAYYPVHRTTIEQFGAMNERGTKWTRAGNLVGNGAFQLVRWAPHEVIVVERNPHYWDAASVRLDAIHFHPIDDRLTEERSFRSGELHMTESVPMAKLDTYRENHPELLRIDPYLGTYFYRFNVTQPPLNDVRVRRALAMSINRESLARNVVKGGREPSPFFTPPNTAGYTCASQLPYDPEQARALLADAGYPGGDGFPSLELLYNTSEDHRTIAEAIQRMWHNELGIEIGLVNQDWKVYLAAQNNLDYMISRSAWIGDFVDPLTFLGCFTSDDGNNRTGWASPRYDELIDRARHAADPDARRAYFQQAEAILLEEAPIAPIYFYTRQFLKTPRLMGVEPNLLGYVSFKDLYIEPEVDSES